MLVIVGTYREGHQIIALKVYDTVENKMGMYYKKDVLKAASNSSVTIIGIDHKEDGHNVSLSYQGYNVKALDIVDGAGNVIEDRGMWIPLETQGFGDATQIKVVNSIGITKMISMNEFMELLDNRKIVGAKRNRSGVTYHKYCQRKGITFENTTEISN